MTLGTHTSPVGMHLTGVGTLSLSLSLSLSLPRPLQLIGGLLSITLRHRYSLTASAYAQPLFAFVCGWRA